MTRFRTVCASLIFLQAALVVCNPTYVRADSADWQEQKDSAQQRNADAPGQATFDKRLPPLLPGQEVNAGGNRMKMWSTTGPVGVSQAPEPWQKHDHVSPDNVDVIIDQRSHRPEKRSVHPNDK